MQLREREAILKTQKNAKIQVNEETPDGQYLQAEVDGGLGCDVMEFLIKRDVVAYRSMATKVTYTYPFTTALGDSKGQTERMNKFMEELGWYAPSFESMDQSMQSSAEDFMEQLSKRLAPLQNWKSLPEASIASLAGG